MPFFYLTFLRTNLNPLKWWNQFPSELKLITRIRFFASLGAGGVIYLTPLAFYGMNFSSTQIGKGIALAAFVGTIARLISGRFLDIGLKCSWPVRWTVVLAILADLCFIQAGNFQEYLQAQILLGLAAGFYWPAVELAVPLSCGNYPSMRGFSLVRSADALGMSLGALFGTISALVGVIKMVYILDIIWMLFVLAWLIVSPITDRRINFTNQKFISKQTVIETETVSSNWILKILPLLVISFIATAMFALLQSSLSLDLVQGGIFRPPVTETWCSALIAIQLVLLVVFQWPVGRWLTDHDVSFGLGLSMLGFSVGSLLLCISTFLKYGVFLVALAQVPLSLSIAAFLPTATEAIIKVSPKYRKGIALAFFSQCFALSAVIAPVLAGYLLDLYGNGFILWSIMSLACIFMLALNKSTITSY